MMISLKKNKAILIWPLYPDADWAGGKPENFPVGRCYIYLIYYFIFKYLDIILNVSNHNLILLLKKNNSHTCLTFRHVYCIANRYT